MAFSSEHTRAYYRWVEHLFRVLDDIDETAVTRIGHETGGPVPKDGGSATACALDALSLRLRTVLGEGRRSDFATPEFSERFEPLLASIAALGEAGGRAAKDVSPRRFDTLMRECRREVFRHAPH